jgi:hypothetical protein
MSCQIARKLAQAVTDMPSEVLGGFHGEAANGIPAVNLANPSLLTQEGGF